LPNKDIPMSDALSTLTFQINQTPEFAPEGSVRVDAVLNGNPIMGQLIDVAAVIYGGAAERCSYYLFTCSCGAAGCNGFHTPLEQTRADGRVIWEIEDEKLAKILGSQKLIFDADDFDAARLSLLADLKDLEAKGLSAEFLMEEDYGSEGAPMKGIPLAEIANRTSSYFHGQTKMYAEMDKAAEDGDTASLRAKWEQDEAFINFTPANLAARLLNLSDSVYPDDEARAEALTEVARIVRAFFNDSDVAEAEKAFAPFRRFLKEDLIDDPEAVYFCTDEDGPYVRLP
jgi:hypothetical protein